jgi:hypothetical protein
MTKTLKNNNKKLFRAFFNQSLNDNRLFTISQTISLQSALDGKKAEETIRPACGFIQSLNT